MLESGIERKLVKAVEKAGGLCLKFAPPGQVGYPDRLVLLPGGLVSFVELKRKGEKARKIQVARHDKLRSLDLQVYLVDDPQIIDTVIVEMKAGGRDTKIHSP